MIAGIGEVRAKWKTHGWGGTSGDERKRCVSREFRAICGIGQLVRSGLAELLPRIRGHLILEAVFGCSDKEASSFC